MTMTFLWSTSQVFCRMPFNWGLSNIFTWLDYGFSEVNYKDKCPWMRYHTKAICYQYDTPDVNLYHWAKVVFARFLHCYVNLSPTFILCFLELSDKSQPTLKQQEIKLHFLKRQSSYISSYVEFFHIRDVSSLQLIYHFLIYIGTHEYFLFFFPNLYQWESRNTFTPL